MKTSVGERLGSSVRELLSKPGMLPRWAALLAVFSVPVAKNLPSWVTGHSKAAEACALPAMLIATVVALLVIALTHPQLERSKLVQGVSLGLRIACVPLCFVVLAAGGFGAALTVATLFYVMWWLSRTVSRGLPAA